MSINEKYKFYDELDADDIREDQREALETRMRVFLYDLIINKIPSSDYVSLFSRTSCKFQEHFEEQKTKRSINTLRDEILLFIDFCFNSRRPSRITYLVAAIKDIIPSTSSQYVQELQELEERSWMKR